MARLRINFETITDNYTDNCRLLFLTETELQVLLAMTPMLSWSAIWKDDTTGDTTLPDGITPRHICDTIEDRLMNTCNADLIAQALLTLASSATGQTIDTDNPPPTVYTAPNVTQTAIDIHRTANTQAINSVRTALTELTEITDKLQTIADAITAQTGYDDQNLVEKVADATAKISAVAKVLGAVIAAA